MRPLAGSIIAAVLLALCFAAPVRAQETAWVQVEALRTLAEARQRARAYEARFDNVAGFRLATGWYAIALGPFPPPLARAELAALRRAGLIPADSYLAAPSDYGRRFWPVGAGARALPADPPDGTGSAAEEPQAPAAAAPDQTPAEARRGERRLTGAERRELQEALRWFGHYRAAIDGAFGRGTRRAMSEWQAAQGYPVTGVLTRGQRRELLAAYRAPFEALGLATVRDEAAGIELVLPAGRVSHARTEAPFVHYDSDDGSGMRVLLISQSGDEAALFGLYEVMQTLEIVPPEGPRERGPRAFTLRGTSPELSSHTEARLEDGAIKGFTLVWREGDPRVIERVIERMRESFTRLPAVLPDDARDGGEAEAGAEAGPDLLAGLELRRPQRTRTGFFVDAGGIVLTAAEAVADCARLTLGDAIEARVAARDPGLGLALLRPEGALAPRQIAAFRPGEPRLRSELAVAGFSYGASLPLPVLTYGMLADRRGLAGEERLARLALDAQPGDVGGPVLDSAGGVVGAVTVPESARGRRLPEGVAIAVDAPAIVAFLSRAGLSPRQAGESAPRPPERIAELAADMAVQVNCWD